MDIEDLKNRLGRKFRGASLDDVQGIENFSIFAEAASNLLSFIDPYETVRLHRFDVFQGVRYYAPATDFKGKKLIDPRPQDGRSGESFAQTYTKELHRDEEYGKVTVEYLDGVKVLGIVTTGKSAQDVDKTNSATGWSAAGGATGLEVDDVLRLDNSDTLRFDLGATGGYVENSSLTEVDLSEDEDASSFFRKVYIPSGASTLTSITLRIGSASGAYWLITGEPHLGSYRNGVNIVRFDWADATEPGTTPDASAIDYERLTFVTTATMADVRVGPLSSRMPTPYETPYYSNCLFRDTSGTWLSEPTADTDTIVLEKEAENIFFYECCELIAEDLTLDSEATKYKKRLHGDPEKQDDDGGLYGQYKRDKPTEALRPHSQGYRPRPARGSGRRIRLRE